MDINNLKCIVGKAEHEKPAIIRLFGAIDECNCNDFNSEFIWLEQVVKPSKIVVLINSEGGSCLRGMSVFSTIQASEIEVECINEGLAASMASVIWIAGTRSYMRDYSILMIHNPFCEDDSDEGRSDEVSVFKQQLATIYSKRFGMSNDKIKSIMEGPDGADGTFFNAQQAVDAGIIPPENIIKTSKQTRNKVKGKIEAIKETSNIRMAMDSIYAEVDENKLSDLLSSIHNQTNLLNKLEQESTMAEKNIEFAAIAAQLGFAEDIASVTVSAKVADLLKTEAKLKTAEEALAALQITNKGNEAKIVNIQTKLNEVSSKLTAYQEAEQAAKKAEIVALVDEAVKVGKIEDSAKEQWVTMATTNLELVKNTLASIAAREKITEEIAKDPENVQAAVNGAVTEEAKLAAKVNAVVGSEFKFKKL